MHQYEQKAAPLTDVLQQQATLAQVNQQYQQALSSFWTAKADFERVLCARSIEQAIKEVRSHVQPGHAGSRAKHRFGGRAHPCIDGSSANRRDAMKV